MKKTRRKFTGAFKAKVAIEVLKERESLAELSKHYEVHPIIISKWKKEFLENSAHVFHQQSKETEKEIDIEFNIITARDLHHHWDKRIHHNVYI